MKRLILIFSLILLLTACGRTEELPVVSEEVLPLPAPTEEVTPPVEVETTVVVPEETVIADGGNIVHYTSEMVEGLVEDTVGYTFEIPTFDAEGAEALVVKTDKRRANYYNYFTGGKWGKAENYDLILNTSRMDLDKIVEVIKAYVSLR